MDSFIRKISNEENITYQNEKREIDISEKDNPNVLLKIAEQIIVFLSVLLIIALFPFSLILCLREVKQYEKAVILRLGKLRPVPTKGPGLIFFVFCTDNVIIVDLRTVAYDVPPQEVLTKDSCTITVDAVTYYSVKDPVKAVIQVDQFRYATSLLSATVLRNIVGQKNLTEILSERESIALLITSVLDVATDPWGVWVERVEIKDVRLPAQMQKAMAAEAEATREARAKVIAAEGELKAAPNLKDASDVISQNPTALQLRYLQTMNSIASEKNSTVIFPLPIDLISAFKKR